ncbi:Methionine import ATP-binding protein MetN [Planctomycetes bacterium Poly30]|uniref:Methionine import ATP-binding protein MetN n=1 Tax=Saltatorellus ferox TaxID=2528018 RepID=A0A518EUM9_9BACT|nr:Methionine import ATP-binding protein MetN [Planctomycetes bacterium Poly30]
MTDLKSSSEDIIIRFKDVYKSFGRHDILKGISFEVPRGQVLGLMGGSGTGKSVTLRHVIGLLKPDSGRVEVEGRNVPDLTKHELADLRKRMGYVFQEGALINWLTVAENLALPLQENTKLSKSEIDDLIAEKLKMVHIPDAGEKLPSEISGGMKKRVGLARALITDPDIILYDEPNAGLDPQIARSINELMREIADQHHATALVVEHRLECIETVCDEVVFLYGGKALVHEKTADFLRPTHPQLIEFLGPEARNA